MLYWSSYESIVSLAEAAHEEILKLCVLLESVADSLPGNADPDVCTDIAISFEAFICGVHRFEETALFPIYAELMEGQGRECHSVERLQSEHVQDECYAGDLTEALLVLGRRGAVENPETLGFMLRGFFETQRRHIAFEREHILAELRNTCRWPLSPRRTLADGPDRAP